MERVIPISVMDSQTSAATDASLSDSAALLALLGQPHRLGIFRLLIESELCVCELEERLGLSPSLLAHHLRMLRKSGLVQVRRGVRDARWLYYSLEPGAFIRLQVLLKGICGTQELPPQARCGSSCSCG